VRALATPPGSADSRGHDGPVDRCILSEARRSRLVRLALWLLPLGALINLGLLFAGQTGLRHWPGIVAPSYLFIGIPLAFTPWVTNALRTRLWTWFLGHPVRLFDCLRVFWGTILGGAVTPTPAGAAVFKWALLRREGVPGETAATIATIAALEDLLFFAAFLPVALATSAMTLLDRLPSLHVPAVFLAIVLLIGLVAILLLTRRSAARLRAAILRTGAEVRRAFILIARRGKRVFLAAATLTTLQWLARYSVASFVIAALGGPFHPLLFIPLQWMVFTLATFVPTPGGTGALEGAFLLVYGPFLPPPVLVPAMALWRLCLFYGPIALAALCFLATQKRRPPALDPEDGAGASQAHG
jgi:uncharacterized protein (TIRG00374 family)